MKANLYTVIYAAASGLVIALILTGVGGFTAPYREANERSEAVRNIMKVLGVEHDPRAPAEDLLKLFEQEVEARETEQFVYYLYSPADLPADQVRTAVSFSGSGMWGPVEGFLALEPDMRTIAGLSVYRQEETPGLGGEIGSEWFEQQFEGRSIFDQEGNPGINIVGDRDAEEEYEIDAITGATMSSNSLEQMINRTIRTVSEQEKF